MFRRRLNWHIYTLPYGQIESEQGFLNNPVSRRHRPDAGKRIDVLVDFTGINPGVKIVMQNIGPDSPS